MGSTEGLIPTENSYLEFQATMVSIKWWVFQILSARPNDGLNTLEVE